MANIQKPDSNQPDLGKPDKRLTPARPDLAAKYLEHAVKAARYSDGTLMQVCVGVSPLYRDADHSAPRETELLYGEQFTVYESRNGWAWGQSHFDQYVGYTPSDALAPAKAHKKPQTHNKTQNQNHHDLTVNALRTYIFSKPDIKSKPLHLVSMNSPLKKRGQEGRFSELETGGFIIAAHTSPINSHSDDFVKEAEKFLGTPYLWGGRSSLGLDCSALVQNALRRSGIFAPRDTDMQEKQIGTKMSCVVHGKDLETVSLQRGDLIFWKGHVAIMQDAHNIVHANGTWMRTTSDPLDEFCARVAKDSGPITSIRRPMV